MADYNHILFAADLSADTPSIGERAINIAKRFGARLSLLHVIKERDVGAELEAAGIEATHEPVPHETKLETEALAKHRNTELGELAERLGVKDAQKWVIVSNDVADQIHRVANEQGVDLIVVGSHGKHGLALLLGSTSNAVLHGTPCDVLAVRAKT